MSAFPYTMLLRLAKQSCGYPACHENDTCFCRVCITMTWLTLLSVFYICPCVRKCFTHAWLDCPIFFTLTSKKDGYNCMVLLTCPAAKILQRVPGVSWPLRALSQSCLHRSRQPLLPWAGGSEAFAAACQSSVHQHCYRSCRNVQCRSLPWLRYLWKLPFHFLHSFLNTNRNTYACIKIYRRFSCFGNSKYFKEYRTYLHKNQYQT